MEDEFDFIDLDDMNIPLSILNAVDKSLVHAFRLVPIRIEEGWVIVAQGKSLEYDPWEIAGKLLIVADLNQILGRKVKAVRTSREALDRAIKRYYPLELDGEGDGN